MCYRTPFARTVALAFSAGLAAAAGPAAAVISMSRGQQFFPITHDECMTRARAALVAAGYALWSEPGNGPWGAKGDHGATIFCEPAAGDREVVDILVATAGTGDGNVPGAERVRLQELMERSTTPARSECPGNAVDLRGSGRVLTCWCTAPATTGGSVWGSGVYTDDSIICRAALHAGVVGPGGGQVTLRVLPGQTSYPSTTNNGVTTTSFGTWHGSYRFE
jgi:LCCL domain-containing protein